ncbi:MAG TPA: GntR family transcriptional regulator [Anaerolineales bacterium]|nr:GntR family transcriptional regulator [Anaerolineales bacterium]
MTPQITRTVKSTLVASLRDEIIRGEYLPGQRLLLEDIAARFDISTTPVREALSDLEAEGIVTIFPHRGAVVTQFSADDLQDIYDIRATLEEMATRLAVPNVTEAILKQMIAYIDQMDSHLGELVTLVKLNHSFHITLYNASGRQQLCKLTNMLRYRTQHYLHAYISYLGGMPQAQADHRAVVEACARGEVERAAKLIHDHVATVGGAIVEYVRNIEESKS